MSDTITIDKEVYFRLRVDAEENERFHNWDISGNWEDYDSALYLTDQPNGETVLTIVEWEAKLRKELFGEG